MRTLTSHKLAGLNDALEITVLDEPGHGGACHEYEIIAMNEDGNGPIQKTKIHFQNGPIKEHGVNGISQEALLAIVIDRLTCFQAGPFSSGDNFAALQSCMDAMTSLQRRTEDRLARGVEGTSAQ